MNTLRKSLVVTSVVALIFAASCSHLSTTTGDQALPSKEVRISDRYSRDSVEEYLTEGIDVAGRSRASGSSESLDHEEAQVFECYGPAAAALALCQEMFVVTENGFPHVVEQLKPIRPNRLSVMAASWSQSKAYDGGSRWQPKAVDTPTFNLLQRFLAHTFYNPSVDLEISWEVSGDCSLAEIVSDVERGLEQDDDIIQQWFAADEVLKLIRSATTFDEMVDRIRCICGEFEAHDRLRKVVNSVLGKNRI